MPMECHENNEQVNVHKSIPTIFKIEINVYGFFLFCFFLNLEVFYTFERE